MITSDACRIPRLTVDATVREASNSMAESGTGAALVVDSLGVIGVVTADGVADGAAEPDRSVLDFMTFEVVRIDPDDDWVTIVRTYQEAATRSVARRHVGTRVR
jgi:CBS domain-containing protein